MSGTVRRPRARPPARLGSTSPAPPFAAPAPSRATIAHYDRHAEAYRSAALGHAIPENHAAFLSALPGGRASDLLDLGCGAGRDLAALKEAGHRVLGLDGSPAAAAMARAHSGCAVLVQDFLALDLAPASFDGIFANASLFHVPSAELPRVLADLSAALRPGGVLFANNPVGAGEEGWAEDRWICLWQPRRWSATVAAAGFRKILEFRRPPGRPRSEQLWLATLWRKPG
jgi:SAM-dependent methyltransferase